MSFYILWRIHLSHFHYMAKQMKAQIHHFCAVRLFFLAEASCKCSCFGRSGLIEDLEKYPDPWSPPYILPRLLQPCLRLQDRSRHNHKIIQVHGVEVFHQYGDHVDVDADARVEKRSKSQGWGKKGLSRRIRVASMSSWYRRWMMTYFVLRALDKEN